MSVRTTGRLGRSLGLHLLAAASSVAFVAAAHAEDLPGPVATDAGLASAETTVGDIVVTAQRRSENIQKTPLAITAFSQDSIEQQKLTTFRDLSGRIPGLLAPKRSTAYTTQTYAIRGIGEIDTYPEPSVAVYVDDVYLARTVGSVYDTPDLERVEVLRGPQGTLYGRNSSAGAIRFITREPTSDLSGEAGITYGSYRNLELKGRLSGPILADDKLNGSISLIRHTRRGWTRSVPLDRWVNDLDLTVLRLKLQSQVTDRLKLTFSADGMTDHSSQSYYTPVNQPDGVATGAATDPDLTWSNTLPYNRTQVGGMSLTAAYEIDDHLTFKSVSALRGMHGPIYYDNDGVTWIKGDSSAGFDQHYRTQEFDLNGEWDRFNFVVGAYYFYEFFHNDRLSQSAASPLNNVGRISHSDSILRTESGAVFGQLNYKLTDKLTATVGGRYTIDNRKFVNVGAVQGGRPLVYPLPADVDSLFTPAAARFDVTTPWTSFSSFTPKLAVQYDWTPDILTYASYSQGFKSGGYDIRATTAVSSATPYRPQVTTTYEVGLKSKLFDSRFTANLAVFYNRIKDFQVRATDVVTKENQLLNAGDANSRGVELELAAVPIDGLKLTGSVAWLKTGYDTFTANLPANVAGRTTLLGLDFPFAPKWQIAGSASYRLPLRTSGDWRIGVDAQYEARRYIDIFNTVQTLVQPQTFVNGTVNYTSADQGWSGGVAVKNIFDLRRNQAGGYNPANAGAEALYYRAYNEPRMINVFINRRF